MSCRPSSVDPTLTDIATASTAQPDEQKEGRGQSPPPDPEFNDVHFWRPSYDFGDLDDDLD